MREICRQRGLSLKFVAEQVGVSAESLSRYETGKRRWPRSVLQKINRFFGLDLGPWEPEWALSWTDHLKWSQWEAARVEVEGGPTWADTPPGYPSFYSSLRPSRLPPLEFRRLFRMDSALEGCAYSELCEAGANPLLASPLLLGFDRHLLTDAAGRPSGLLRRAGLRLPWGWLLFPQVTFQLETVRVRLDALAAGPRGAWAGLEFDGPVHESEDWSSRRDAMLKLPIYRFRQAEILGGSFCALLQTCLRSYPLPRSVVGRS